MEEDRELLKLAAKAAGVPASQWDYDRLRSLGHMVTRSMLWNPLTDDGDALRLAVSLKLWTHSGMGYYLDQPRPYAAVRLAIVRAAAEIGKAMP
jgi:hypothetical protein